MQAPTAPAVGILWRVADCLVLDRSVLAEAEPYGDCLTHPGGHYERWEAWQALSAPALRAAGLPAEIAVSEYDDWPRGRVVYEVPARRFVLYADRRLHGREIIDLLRKTFGLQSATVAVRADPHYR
ncbi:hypothetical protein SAMN04488144_13226 [Methylobacterium sp. 190mf]|uniref:hypothetical protein n=1 Tax=Methylobacterium sp. 190mf TaxID=1761798 RepID=UPI00089EBCD6|nr:hypothetical protein [Methylobacterium sp. 190mf]SEG64462.1 hypothetical protein SAMN04488144_13226 [Methylobacterium sp. 190mf]